MILTIQQRNYIAVYTTSGYSKRDLSQAVPEVASRTDLQERANPGPVTSVFTAGAYTFQMAFNGVNWSPSYSLADITSTLSTLVGDAVAAAPSTGEEVLDIAFLANLPFNIQNRLETVGCDLSDLQLVGDATVWEQITGNVLSYAGQWGWPQTFPVALSVWDAGESAYELLVDWTVMTNMRNSV